ncbi:MAG: hypothetical protein M1834_006522 [Cirrosporium novae-zelandiae]|nr:MAG: hypothetical protein M1834_006522 [Cirrosporium novae-zelandiae]
MSISIGFANDNMLASDQHPMNSSDAQAYTTQLVHSLQPAPWVKFDSNARGVASSSSHHHQDRVHRHDSDEEIWAHKAGVNALDVDRFEGKYMVTGGADASIRLWDLEAIEGTTSSTHRPLGSVPKSSSHKFSITHLSFYPFDTDAFLSSSYDATLSITSTSSLTPSYTFSLTHPIYSHALSPIASHLLVAVATRHPAVRLVDLRSASTAHSLPGHSGPVLSVSWSPRTEHILASAGADGTVRLWDIRRGSACLGMLDMEDSIGILGHDGHGTGARNPTSLRKAHNGPSNGVTWTGNGEYLVTCGHDGRIRVWDAGTGANTLAHFGPTIRNTGLATVLPVIVPHDLVEKKWVLCWPNEKEVLVCDMLEGTLLQKLKIREGRIAQGGRGERNVKGGIRALSWRGKTGIELYAGCVDGTVKCFMPETMNNVEDDGDEDGEEIVDESKKKRKREVLDEIYRDLTKQKITFT